MKDTKTYVGIHHDAYGGMTPLGGIIRDAWVFGILPDSETCQGWSMEALQPVWDKVSAAWESYGYSVAQLPEALRQRHERIHREAMERARALGWDPGAEDDGD